MYQKGKECIRCKVKVSRLKKIYTYEFISQFNFIKLIRSYLNQEINNIAVNIRVYIIFYLPFR